MLLDNEGFIEKHVIIKINARGAQTSLYKGDKRDDKKTL